LIRILSPPSCRRVGVDFDQNLVPPFLRGVRGDLASDKSEIYQRFQAIVDTNGRAHIPVPALRFSYPNQRVILVNRRQILAISLLITGISFGLARETPEPVSIPLAAISQDINPQVTEIASQVTVRIISDSGAGSGVIIQRAGQVYTVLTRAC